MDFFKNLIVNLTATGPAAIFCVWIIAMAALGLLGNGPLADRSLTLLLFIGAALIGVLGGRGWR